MDYLLRHVEKKDVEHAAVLWVVNNQELLNHLLSFTKEDPTNNYKLQELITLAKKLERWYVEASGK